MKRRVLWCALILSLIITLVWPLVPIPSATARLAAIPTTSLDFLSQPIGLSPSDIAFLGQAQSVQYLITMRDGTRLVLSVIDGTHNRHAVHDPSYCFAGAGWVVESRKPLTVPSGTATWVSMAREHQKSEALWFFDDGKHQFTSSIEYWLAASMRRASLGLSGAEPVLVTLRSLPDEPVQWDRVRQILLPALGFR